MQLVSVGVVLGSLAALCHLAGYTLYLREVVRKQITPNALSYAMFAYGTLLLAVLTAANGATLPELMLPVLCGSASAMIAVLSWKRRAAEPVETYEWVVFATDVILTATFVALQLLGTSSTATIVVLLVLGNVTTLTAFLPILTSTYRTPYRERPLPWLVWTAAYLLLTLTVFAETGMRQPVLLMYPVLNLILHATMIAFTVRRSLRGRTMFTKGANSLYHGRSGIAGIGLFTRRRIAMNAPIWTLTGKVRFQSPTTHHPDFVGLGPGVWIDPDQPLKRLNHCCQPNTALGARRRLYALRPIAPDEELTLDYSTTEADPDWSMPCSCKASTCRRQIRAIQIAFADAAFAPPASPLMRLVWAKRVRLVPAIPTPVAHPTGPALRLPSVPLPPLAEPVAVDRRLLPETIATRRSARVAARLRSRG